LKAIETVYPNVRLVVDDLDSTDVLLEEAKVADVVVHLASTNHVRSVQAISNGLMSQRRPKPAHWIQISGGAMFSIPEMQSNTYGEASDKIWDELEGKDEVIKHLQANQDVRVVDN
jgi:hypothetical protein